MFGRRKKVSVEPLEIEGASFMTIGQATTAVCSRHSDPSATAKYFGNLLVGVMAAYGIGPTGSPDERHLWELMWSNFGGPELGDSWHAVAALPVDTNATLRLSEILAPTLMSTSRDKVEEASEGSLCGLFGRSQPNELDVTERMICHIGGMSMKTIADDALTGPSHELQERLSIGAKVVTVYVMLGAKMEALRKARGGT